MTHQEASDSPLQDEWGTFDLPKPVKPDEKILRELAKAGMSKRGLIVASDRKTARRVRAELAREALLRPFMMRWATLRAQVLAVIKRARPLVAVLGASTAGIFVLVYFLSRSVPIAIALTVGADIIGLVLRYVVRRRQER